MKNIALVLPLTIALLLSACNNTNDQTDNSPNDQASENIDTLSSDEVILPTPEKTEEAPQIKDEIAQGAAPQPCYRLYADVDFKFDDNANWLSRWGAALWTQVDLPSGFAKLDEAARKNIIKNSIRAHYQERGANVPYDGAIKGYRLIIELQDKEVERIEYDLPKSKSV